MFHPGWKKKYSVISSRKIFPNNFQKYFALIPKIFVFIEDAKVQREASFKKAHSNLQSINANKNILIVESKGNSSLR